ncbi:MAG: hypothetical protein JKY54_04650 [Flavobacteriales bacterium]|nr:hypothetical protein [Flavobacteriales bacterium]
MDLKLASKDHGYITFNRYQLLDDIISHYARVKEKELHLADEFTLYDRGKYAFL